MTITPPLVARCLVLPTDVMKSRNEDLTVNRGVFVVKVGAWLKI
jgi:hypothetical protein